MRAAQSFNVHMSDANFGKLTSLHFYAWRKGLKTGMYYLRTRAASDAIKFTVDQQAWPLWLLLAMNPAVLTIMRAPLWVEIPPHSDQQTGPEPDG